MSVTFDIAATFENKVNAIEWLSKNLDEVCGYENGWHYATNVFSDKSNVNNWYLELIVEGSSYRSYRITVPTEEVKTQFLLSVNIDHEYRVQS